MADCVFCKIRDGQIPSVKVYEDDKTFCIMDINPLNRGHCLVITKVHAATLFESKSDDLAAAIGTVRRVARAIKSELRPDGLNVLQANGPAAFQSVQHFHLHLIPRFTNDGKGLDWTPPPGDRAEIMKTGETLRTAVAAETRAAPIAAPGGQPSAAPGGQR